MWRSCRITGSEADAYADNVAGNDPAPGTIVYTGDLEHGFTSARLSEVFGLKLEGDAREWALERVRAVTDALHRRNML